MIRIFVPDRDGYRSVYGPRGTRKAEGKAEGARMRKRPVPRLDKFTPLQFAVQAGQIEAAGQAAEAAPDPR